MSTYGTPSAYGTAIYGAPVSSGGGGSGAGGGMPAVLVEVAFATNPPFMPIWTDISEYVRGFSTKRGRQFELDRMQTGVAQLVLDNQDRRFDPTHTSSPYYPYVKPMRRIRIHAIWDEIIYPVFTGYVESWPQEWSANGLEAHSAITASDGFVAFSFAKINRSFPEEMSHERIKEVMDEVQWGSGQAGIIGDVTYGILGDTLFVGPVGDRVISTGATEVQASTLNNVSALDHLLLTADTEGGLLFVSREGAMTFYGRHARLLSPPFNASQATFGDGGGAELPYSDMTFDQSRIWNDVVLQRDGGSTQSAEDATSILTYFKRTYQRSGLLHSSDDDVAIQASYILSRYRDPLMLISGMTVQPRRSPTVLWPQVLTREIGDRITVRRRPPGGGATIEQELYVEGIQHQAAAKQWTCQYWLSPADTADYLIVGEGLVGTGLVGY